MERLTEAILRLRKSKVRKLVESRIDEFRKIGNATCNEIFKELCFCILTANFNAEKTIKIQKKIDNEFLTLRYALMAKNLKELGYRYPNTRSIYIINARKYKKSLKDIIKSFDNEHDLREWLVKNIKGLSYKESSHFLRNIGYTNLAIIDFHIVNLLASYNLIKKPKTLTRRKYLEIEYVLKKIARKTNLKMSELDLYLWYMETGKILK